MKRSAIVAVMLWGLAFPHSARAEIDFTSGDFRLQAQDLTLGESGIDVTVDRVWSSSDRESGLFGKGWKTTLVKRMEATLNGIRVYDRPWHYDSFPSGNEGHHQPGVIVGGIPDRQGAPWLNSDPQSNDKILTVPEGWERQTAANGREYYDQDGRLTQRRDRNGNVLRIRYFGGHPVSLVDNLGRSLALTYDSVGRVIRAEANTGDHADYGYDNLGRLISVTASGGQQTNYAYDEFNRLIKVEKAGVPLSGIGYIGPGSVVASVTEDKTTARYRFIDLDYPLQAARSGREVVSVKIMRQVNDRAEEPFETLSFQSGPRLHNLYLCREETGWNGTGWNRVMTHDDRGNITEVENRGNDGVILKVTYAYDHHGNVTALAASDGRALQIHYDGSDRIAALETGGKTAEFSYDDHSRLSQTTMAGLGVITRTYVPEGTPVDTPDGDGAAISDFVTKAENMRQELMGYDRASVE